MTDLTPDDLRTLAELFADDPWTVYVQGLDEVFTCPHAELPPGHACTETFDRLSALRFAAQLRESARAVAAVHGLDALNKLTPFVLHHGIVWTQT